jgi:restriction system protein
MAKRALQGIETMVLLRWPVGLLAGLAICLAAHYGRHDPAALMPLAGRPHDLPAWCLLGACWFAALCASPGYRRRRQRRELRHELDRLASLPQDAFEEAVVEAFHRRGYVVEDSARDADGALAELLLYRNGAATLVSCQGWRRRRLDAGAVRELPAQMARQHAASAKILSIGDYTDDAWKLVVGRPIELIHGEALLAMLREARTPTPPNVRTLTRPAARRVRHQPLRLVR